MITQIQKDILVANSACCFANKMLQALQMKKIGDISWKKLWYEAFYISSLIEGLRDYTIIDNGCLSDTIVCDAINRLEIACNACCGGRSITSSVVPNTLPYLTNNVNGIICSGQIYSFAPESNVICYKTWSRAVVVGISNPAASGIGDISETLINTTTSPIVVTYIISLYYNGAITLVNNYVTVYPVDVITQTTWIGFPGGTIHLASFTGSSTIPNCTFSWTNDNTDIGLGASGTGDIDDWEAPENLTGENIVGTITIIATTPNGCTSTFTDTVSIYPLPPIQKIDSIESCSGVTVNVPPFPVIPETTYAWTNTNVAIGLAASGTGDIASWVAPINTSGVDIVGLIGVTATVNGFTYWPVTYNITIHPIPDITSDLSDINLYCGDTLVYTPTSDVAGCLFEWSRAATACCLNDAASGGTFTNIVETLYCDKFAGMCAVVYLIRACKDGCCGEWHELTIILTDGGQPQ
jgi:hypothetical protein